MTITHPELVSALAKPGADIVAALTAEDAHALHMAVGISGEAGELLDAIKKVSIYRKPIDRENVVEELGDIEFYLEGLRQGLGITRHETIQHNIAKLSKRYSSGRYSDQQAQHRADKATTPDGTDHLTVSADSPRVINFESQADELWSALDVLCDAVNDAIATLGDISEGFHAAESPRHDLWRVHEQLLGKLLAARETLKETETV